MFSVQPVLPQPSTTGQSTGTLAIYANPEHAINNIFFYQWTLWKGNVLSSTNAVLNCFTLTGVSIWIYGGHLNLIVAQQAHRALVNVIIGWLGAVICHFPMREHYLSWMNSPPPAQRIYLNNKSDSSPVNTRHIKGFGCFGGCIRWEQRALLVSVYQKSVPRKDNFPACPVGWAGGRHYLGETNLKAKN